MSAENKLDRGIEKGDENTVDLGSWNPEHMGDSVGFKGFHDELCAVHPWTSKDPRSDSALSLRLLRRAQFCG